MTEIKVSEKEILSIPNDVELGKLVRRKYWKLRDEELSKMIEYDHCVICGKQSPYTRDTHIDYRIGYVEGGGQGCFQPTQCDKV